MSTPSTSTFPDTLWAGTEHSLLLAVEAHNKVMAGLLNGSRDDDEEDDDEEEAPYTFSQQGDIGVISIKGSLTNRDSWYNRYIGVTSYAEIRRSLVYAANQPGVKAILLDVDSGGGAVNGVADTGNLIQLIDKNVKPVYAFTDGAMCSAAYWLGCTARQVYSSNTSLVGSIGVICTHMEYSKQLKEMGVGVTVIRAGEYKALANSVEPLTERAKNQLQDQLNAAYSVFLEHVAECRGITVDACDKQMAQGREFFGKDAMQAGLVDGIETFDSVMSRLEVTILDNEKKLQNNSVNSQRGMNMSKQALTEQQIAALAAGAAIQAAGEVPAITDAVPEANAEGAAPDAPVAAGAAAEVTESKNENNEAQASIVSYLQGQVAEKDEKLLSLNLELAGANEKLKGMNATYEGLLAIARSAATNLKIALGAKGVDLSATSAEVLLAEYKADSESFSKVFKAGGVAAVDAASPESVDNKGANPLWSAQVAATRISK